MHAPSEATVQAVLFLTIMNGNAPEDELPLQAFRVFDDSPAKDPAKACSHFGRFLDIEPTLRAANIAGCGVFVVIGDSDGTSGGDDSVRMPRALFLDSDDGPLELSQFSVCPNIIVHSARGDHAYWLLQPGEENSAFTAAQKALAARFRTDPTVCNPSRVMRLPGFKHRKREPFDVACEVYDASTRYTIAGLLPRLGVSAAPTRSLSRAPAPAAASIVEGSRNATLTRLAGSMRRQGSSETVIATALLAHNTERCTPPLDESEVRSIATSIGRYVPAEDLRRGQLEAALERLRGLPARAAVDAGAPFEPDVALDLRTVRELAQPEIARLKSALRGAGVSIRDLVRAVRSAPSPDPFRELHSVLVLDRSAPRDAAQTFVSEHYLRDGASVLHCQQGEYFAWSGTAYSPLEEATIRADVYRFLARAVCESDPGVYEPFSPTRARVDDVIDALASFAQLSSAVHAPAWLPGHTGPDPRNLIACTNGLLDVDKGELHVHTPALFNVNALPFPFDPTARCPEWLKFVGQLWPNDPESIAALQEIMGYLLTPDTSRQKAFLVVGPKRSGKGTIARALSFLLGPDNVCAPTLAGMATNFGLAPLIGKRVAIVSDARLGGRADQAVIAERLLSISGEDSITIDRKYQSGWTGRLQARFLILTNELPRLTDSSGALASRFVILTMSNSFYGHEDLRLTEKLQTEAPGLLNWALDGLRRLRENGHFTQPSSSDDAVSSLEDLASPVGTFVRDRCLLGPERKATSDELYNAYRGWASDQGHHLPSKAVFSRDLHAAVPGLRTERPRDGGRRRRLTIGIGLASTTVGAENADESRRLQPWLAEE